MLTPSSNQYLRPEYLSPLPTTLDAKKSPLALLAQTCSNIGADTPNAKSLIPPVEKREISNSNRDSASEKSSSRDKTTPQSDDKSSFKPYESIKKEENNGNSDNNSNEKSGFRTPTSKSSSPAVSSSGSVNSDKASPCIAAVSSIESTAKTASNNGIVNDGTAVTSSITNPLNSVAAAMQSQHNRISIGCGNMFVEVNHHESGLPKDNNGLLHNNHHHHHHLPLSAAAAAYKSGQLIPGLPPLSSLSSSPASSNCTGCTQVVGHVPVDTSTNPSSYPHTNAGNPLKSSGYPGLSPYVAYARVKTATGGSTLVPICRDPYCTNCQLSMQSAQQLVGVGSCPSGCTQCNHEKGFAAGLGGPLSALSMVPGVMPGVSSTANIVPLGSGIYTQAMLTPRPYVCNWIAGDNYCGKRFTNSEELLQHLRNHTNLSAAESAAAAAAAAAAASLPLLNPSLSLPSAASLGAGCHLHYSMAPSLTSPAGLHRTYPTSLSPVSSLSAASRYHPYKPQFPGLPGVPLSPFPPHPGLSAAAQYFSPYAMYGQRLGAAVHP